jgi:hypothetical protein
MDKHQNRALDNWVEDSITELAKMPGVISVSFELSLAREPFGEPEWRYRLSVGTKSFQHNTSSRCPLDVLGEHVYRDSASLVRLLSSYEPS